MDLVRSGARGWRCTALTHGVVNIRHMQPGSDWVAVIIEDDPDVRDLIDIVLTQSGFRTVVTENGAGRWRPFATTTRWSPRST